MIKIGTGLLFAVALCVLSAAGVRAQTISAASCNASDVQTALNSVTQASATVNIPAGTCAWTSSLSYTVPSSVINLAIQGVGAEYAGAGGAGTAGSDVTIITVNVSGGNPALVLSVASGQSLRITGIDFSEASGYNPSHGEIQLNGSSTSVRVDHCHFSAQSQSGGQLEGIEVDGSITGVADHDFFDSTSSVSNDIRFFNGATWKGDSTGNGNESWSDTDQFGSNEFFFAEDDLFTGGAGDCVYGGRYVIRHSTLTNSVMYNHGTNDSPTRGCRAAEFYLNTITSPSGANGGAAESDNGGPQLVWGNTVTGVRYLVNLGYMRQNAQTYPETAPPNGWGYCGAAQTGSASTWDGNRNSSGYPCLDGPGRGVGDLLTGDNFPNVVNSKTGTQSWPHQALDPVYVWDNTYNNAGYSPEGLVGDETGFESDNLDYYQQFLATYGESGSFNGTTGIGQGSVAPTATGAYPGAPSCAASTDPMTSKAAPGVGWWDSSNNTLYVCNPTNTWTAYYTPYTYPHPLTQSGATVNPPTDLTATPH